MKGFAFLVVLIICSQPIFAQDFTRQSISSTYDAPWRIIPGDLDNDGDEDLVVLSAALNDDDVFCLENDNGTFNIANKVTIADSFSVDPTGMDVGDLDGDGDLDIAASDDDIRILWWSNDGDPFDGTGFTEEDTLIATGQLMETLHIADIDGANNNDILVPYFHNGEDIYYWANDGAASPGFSESKVNDEADHFGEPTFATTGDIDADGDLDVIACGPGDSTIQWYENDGVVPFPGTLVTTTFPDVFVLAVYDVDRDGDLDIIGGGNDRDNKGGPADTGDSLRIFYNSSNGASWTEAHIDQIGDINSIFARDMDGDSDIDILVSSGNIDFSGTGDIKKLIYYENDGAESFTRNEFVTEYNGARSLIPVDIDEDGDPDLISVGLDPTNLDTGGIDWWESNAEDNQPVASGDSSYFWNNRVKVVINSSSGGDDSVFVFYDSESVPDTSAKGSGVASIYGEGFYTITTGKTTVDATLKFDYASVTEWSPISDEDSLLIVAWNGTQWVEAGTSQALDTANDTITVSGVSSFTPFALASSSASPAAIAANIKVFLEGPYDTTGDSLFSSLNDLDLLPTTQPFDTLPWSYSGTESIVSIPDGVVDWVLLELRSDTSADSIKGQRAAFVKSDGTVVDTDGTSLVSFSGLSDGDYYVVIRHRNHIAIMTNSTISLSASSSQYDFTDAQSKAFGTNPMIEVETGIFALIAGDGQADGDVDASDNIVAWRPNNGTSWTYRKYADFDLDGDIDATDNIVKWRPNNGLGTQVP